MNDIAEEIANALNRGVETYEIVKVFSSIPTEEAIFLGLLFAPFFLLVASMILKIYGYGPKSKVWIAPLILILFSIILGNLLHKTSVLREFEYMESEISRHMLYNYLTAMDIDSLKAQKMFENEKLDALFVSNKKKILSVSGNEVRIISGSLINLDLRRKKHIESFIVDQLHEDGPTDLQHINRVIYNEGVLTREVLHEIVKSVSDLEEESLGDGNIVIKSNDNLPKEFKTKHRKLVDDKMKFAKLDIDGHRLEPGFIVPDVNAVKVKLKDNK